MEEKIVSVSGQSDFGQSTVIVVIPAFNEERLIGSVVLKTLCYPVTVVVVDDGSTDLTADLAARAGAQVVRLPENQGKGTALNAGVVKALEYDPDAVVLIDADGQHLPGELPILLVPVLEGRADIVVGSRYIKKGNKVPFHRILGHKFFNFVTGAASGVSVSDSQCGYRAFSRRALDEINFSSTGFSVESEMQFWAHEKHLVVEEVPVTIQYIDKSKRPVMRQGMDGVERGDQIHRPVSPAALFWRYRRSGDDSRHDHWIALCAYFLRYQPVGPGLRLGECVIVDCWHDTYLYGFYSAFLCAVC